MTLRGNSILTQRPRLSVEHPPPNACDNPLGPARDKPQHSQSIRWGMAEMPQDSVQGPLAKLANFVGERRSVTHPRGQNRLVLAALRYVRALIDSHFSSLFSSSYTSGHVVWSSSNRRTISKGCLVAKSRLRHTVHFGRLRHSRQLHRVHPQYPH